jgi:hypothetical protein
MISSRAAIAGNLASGDAGHFAPTGAYDSGMAQSGATPEQVAGRDSFIESLMDTDLYSMGAFFSDEHPDLVEEVVRRSVSIEEQGLESYASAEGISVEEGFRTLLTGLAVRYYKAVAG